MATPVRIAPPAGSRILIVDDEASMREMLGIMLAKEGYEVLVADTRHNAARVLSQERVDVVITDVKLPDGDGLEILRHVKSASPRTIVIVMTAFGSTEAAVAALKMGAQDYLVKPFDIEELRIVIRNCVERQRLEEENRELRAELRPTHGLERLVGGAPAMTALFDLVRTVAPTSSTVLISGESGTGKELVAKSIHSLSRRQGPFVSVNCGALPEPLLESELFGHTKGAFTDASQNKKGLFEVAHRGTLLLDEVGDMSPSMQVKLLRALQERRIRRVGSTDEIDVDVRVVAATNQSLEERVKARLFREDLFYRLNVIPIRTPALRERREDIPLLAGHFLRRFRRDMEKPIGGISPAALALLESHSWPGNVRELENVIERAVALETTGTIQAERLPEHLYRSSSTPSGPALEEGFNLDEHLRTIERGLLERALAAAGQDRAEAARLLGVSARSLRYLLQKHQLTRLA
jgi:two-component system, NtrC family, response regulator PilR